MLVGNQSAGVDGGSGGQPLQGAGPGGQRSRRQGIRLGCGSCQDRVARHRSGQRLRMGVVGVAEGQHLRKRAVGQRREFGFGQRRVGARRTAHRLGGIVDQDVQRPGRRDLPGKGDHLSRVAQVDADDPQPVQPVSRIRQLGEPAYGVAGEPGGDRRVGAVPQQTQRDVHADLRPAAGEQRTPAGQIGARLTFGVAERRTLRTQLVIERVVPGVVRLADVAGARAQQGARTRCGR